MEKVLLSLLAMLFTMLLSLITAVPAGFILMLILGLVHEQVLPAVAPLGFLWSYLLAFMISCFASLIAPTTDSD